MEELNESKTAEVLESEATVEEFEIKEVSLADTTEAPKEKKAIDWLKVGVAGTLACSVLSMGLSCAALIKRTNDASNQNNQSSSNVNDSSSVTISEDGYFVIDGTKTNIKADGSSSEIVDAQIVPTDKWGISTYMMFTFSDGSYVTTQPKVQVLNDHYYDAASVSDLEILTATYAAPKVRLTSNINVTSALEKSCNIYFFELGRELGIDKMNKYAALLGLGQKTGVELPEVAGVLASVANKEANGETWNAGDTVQAAIGQSDNLFTPIQLVNYCSTIANGGTRYKPYMIKSVLSADLTEVIYETTPEVLNTLPISKSELAIVKQGMRQVLTSEENIAHYKFEECIVEAAGKTGTSQLKRTTDDGTVVDCNNGFFISYSAANFGL
jgi:hypothetical protein